jgi:GAF domain-containing protein
VTDRQHMDDDRPQILDVRQAQDSPENEQERLVAELERRALGLQTAAEVSRAASGVLDPDELMRQVVELARERFDLYYAGLFLVDERGEWIGESGKWAVLRAGTGEAGRQMVERGHKLEIGGASMIGQCVATGRANIQLDVGEAAVRFENPFLPETRSELALPLISRGNVIGAMTIQSRLEAAFGEVDISVLQTMADQVANAIQNARLFALAQRALGEMEALNAISRAVSRSLDLDQVLREALSHVIEIADLDVGLISLADPDSKRLYLAVEQDLPQEMRQRFESVGFQGTLCDVVYQQGNTLVVDTARSLKEIERSEGIDTSGLLAAGLCSYLGVPLVSRGNTLGTICVFGYKPLSVDPSRLSLMQAVGQQVGVAVENARLFLDAQRRADRERLSRQISDRILNASDIGEILQVAAEALSRELNASEVIVRLGPETKLL